MRPLRAPLCLQRGRRAWIIDLGGTHHSLDLYPIVISILNMVFEYRSSAEKSKIQLLPDAGPNVYFSKL